MAAVGRRSVARASGARGAVRAVQATGALTNAARCSVAGRARWLRAERGAGLAAGCVCWVGAGGRKTLLCFDPRSLPGCYGGLGGRGPSRWSSEELAARESLAPPCSLSYCRQLPRTRANTPGMVIAGCSGMHGRHAALYSAAGHDSTWANPPLDPPRTRLDCKAQRKEYATAPRQSARPRRRPSQEPRPHTPHKRPPM